MGGVRGGLPAPLVFLAVLASQGAAVRAGEASVGSDGAFEDCPCIVNASLLGAPNRSVPEDYGVGECRAWDAHGGVYSQCAAAQAASWCSLRWCYVDEASCKRSAFLSSIYAEGFFSYTSCGNVENFRPGEFAHANKESRALPTRTLYAYAGGGDARVEPSPGGPIAIQNALLAYAHIWLVEMGVNPLALEYRELSNASRNFSKSSYTACVHDVALGNIDLCLGGGWWDTFERRAMSVHFSGAAFSDDMYFVTIGEDPWIEMAFRPLYAFTWQLWISILVTWFFSGLAMAFFERHSSEGVYAHLSWRETAIESVFHTLQAVVFHETTHGPQTKSGRIFVVGIGCFFLIVVTSLTANMAYFLSATQADWSDDLATYVRNGRRICHAPGFKTTLQQMFPNMQDLSVPVDTLGVEVPNYIAAGLCDAGIMSYWLIRQHWADAAHCNLALVGQPVISIPAGYYVADDLRHSASWALSRKRSDGTWHRVANAHLPPDKCPLRGGAGTSKQMKAEHMLGMQMALGGFFVVALAIRLYEQRCKPPSEGHGASEAAGAAKEDSLRHAACAAASAAASAAGSAAAAGASAAASAAACLRSGAGVSSREPPQLVEDCPRSSGLNGLESEPLHKPPLVLEDAGAGPSSTSFKVVPEPPVAPEGKGVEEGAELQKICTVPTRVGTGWSSLPSVVDEAGSEHDSRPHGLTRRQTGGVGP